MQYNGTMANQFLGLSLFIMLLSFFIIMNAVSGFDPEKSQPVLNSLILTFSAPDTKLIETGEVEGDDGSEFKGKALDKIQELFSAHITGVKAKQNRFGTSLRIRMNIDEFEKVLINDLRPNLSDDAQQGTEQRSLLPTLISLLDTTKSGQLYTMGVVAYTLDGNDVETIALAQKISALSSSIENAGLPTRMLSIAIGVADSEEKRGKVDLHFTPYAPIDPDLLEQLGTSSGTDESTGGAVQ